MQKIQNIVGWSLLCGMVAAGCNAMIEVTPGEPMPSGGSGGNAGADDSSTSGSGAGSGDPSTGGSGGGGGDPSTGGAGGNGGGSLCGPGSTKPCYTGPAETDGLGACHAGLSICNVDGTAYGECLGEATPKPEACDTPVDDDCNGVVNDVGLPPTILSPVSGQTLPGGSVVFAWSGGTAPYEVDIAFDAAFTKPAMPSITTSDQSIIVDGLNGGYVYWRVRGKGHCGPSTYANGGELHLTCKQIQLRSDPVMSFGQPTIAWNPNDGEYGVVYGRGESGNTYLEFLRTDRLGNIVFGPKKLSSSLMPPIGEGYLSADLIYVPSVDRWATVYHREGVDESHVTLFDDSGNVVASRPLDFGGDTETHTVSYHPSLNRIVTSTDHGGGAWETYVEQFDTSLQKVGKSINTGLSCGYPYNGAFGPTIALPGLTGFPPSALTIFEFRESVSPDVLHLFTQRVNLSSGELAWPPGTSFNCIAGKKLISNSGSTNGFLSAAAWNSSNQNVGLAYASDPVSLPWGAYDDLFFAIVDPKSGQLLTQKTLLNTGVPQKVHTGIPKVAWDGEEFLVLWNDGRDLNFPRQTRMSKFNGIGQLLGSGDQLFVQPGRHNSVHTWSGKGLVGHDRIHTFVSSRWEDSSTPSSLWMCIEPPYSTAP